MEKRIYKRGKKREIEEKRRKNKKATIKV